MQLSFYKDRLKNSSLFRDSSWALFGSVIGKGLSLLAGILVARFLGHEIYGEYGLIKSTLLNISVFSTLGLGYTGTRFIAKSYKENKDEIKKIITLIYRITLLSSSIMAAFLLLFANQVAILIKAPDMTLALRMTAMIIIINAVNTTQIGIMSGLKIFRKIAINNAYAGILTLITSAIFTYFWDLKGSLVALFVSMLFNSWLNYASIHKTCESFGDKREISFSTRAIVSFSIPIALQESLYSIVAWLGSYLIITYSDYGELGINSAAAQWSAVILFIPGVLKNVLLSYFSSSDNTASLRKKMIAINFFATFIPWCIIAIFSKYISSFYGSTYTNLNIVLVISCCTSIFASISSVIIYEFISHGKNWKVFFLRFIRDVSTLLVTWFCLSHIKNIQASILINIVTASIACIFMFILVISIHMYDKSKVQNIVP